MQEKVIPLVTFFNCSTIFKIRSDYVLETLILFLVKDDKNKLELVSAVRIWKLQYYQL